MMSISSGYLGFFKNPIFHSGQPTIYALTNVTAKFLLLIPMTPGAYRYLWATSVRAPFDNIILAPISLDAFFISDVLNTFNDAKEVKRSIRWIYPDKPEIFTNVDFEMSQIWGSRYAFEDISTSRYDKFFNPSITYHFNETCCRSCYDIEIQDEGTTKYFSSFSYLEKIQRLCDNEAITEIHIPFSSTLYGGLSFLELIKFLSREDIAKLRVHSFQSREEMEYCQKNYYKNLPPMAVGV